MSKVCKNCGSPLSDYAIFCPSCGNKVEDVAEPVKETESTTVVQSVSENIPQYQSEQNNISEEKPQKKHKKSFFITLIICLTLVTVIIAGVVYGVVSYNMSFSNVRDAVGDFVDAVYLGDGKACDKLVPEEYEKEIFDYYMVDDYDDMCDGVFNKRSKWMDKLYGDDITVTSRIVDFEYVPSFNEYSYYDLIEYSNGIDELEYDCIYRVKVKIDIKGDDDKDTFYHKLIAVKTDDEWSLYDLNSGSSVCTTLCFLYTVELDYLVEK